jgi:hypothetical protein
MSIHRPVTTVPPSLPDIILVSQDVLYKERQTPATSPREVAIRFSRLLLRHRLWEVVDVIVGGGALAVGCVVLPADF